MPLGFSKTFLAGKFLFGLKPAVAADVDNRNALSAEYAADQQPPMTFGWVFLAAEDRRPPLTGNVEQSLNPTAEFRRFGQPSIKHAPLGVAKPFVVRPPA